MQPSSWIPPFPPFQHTLVCLEELLQQWGNSTFSFLLMDSIRIHDAGKHWIPEQLLIHNPQTKHGLRICSYRETFCKKHSWEGVCYIHSSLTTCLTTCFLHVASDGRWRSKRRLWHHFRTLKNLWGGTCSTVIKPVTTGWNPQQSTQAHGMLIGLLSKTILIDFETCKSGSNRLALYQRCVTNSTGVWFMVTDVIIVNVGVFF